MAKPDPPTLRIGPPSVPVLRCGEHLARDEQEQGRVVTAQFALVWLRAGSAELVDGGGRRHRLGPGDAFHRFPEQAHAVRYAAGTRALFLALPAEGLAFLRAAGCAALDLPVFRPGARAWLERRWLALALERARARPDQLASLAMRIAELALEAHRPEAGDRRLAALMERAAARLADPSAAPLRQPALARFLGLSYRTFRRAFAAFAGASPEAYRIRCRIAAAQELLRGGDLPVAAIAERLGYRDGADFARQFTRIVGCPPTAWRSGAFWG